VWQQLRTRRERRIACNIIYIITQQENRKDLELQCQGENESDDHLLHVLFESCKVLLNNPILEEEQEKAA